MPKLKKHRDFKMEKSGSGFKLSEVSSDIKEKCNNSPGNELNNNRSSLSPPASADDFGAPNTDCSTGDGSVFTFNSVTDESSDEKKSEPSSPVAKNDNARTSSESKDSSTMTDGVSCQDKKSFIKMVLNKEYNHVVRYDIQTLLSKMKEIKELEEAEKKLVETRETKDNETSRKQLDSTSTCEGASSSSSPCPNDAPTIKEKFSSRVLKNLFSAITSPMAERSHNHKKSKSTSSPTHERLDGGTKDGLKDGLKDGVKEGVKDGLKDGVKVQRRKKQSTQNTEIVVRNNPSV